MQGRSSAADAMVEKSLRALMIRIRQVQARRKVGRQMFLFNHNEFEWSETIHVHNPTDD